MPNCEVMNALPELPGCALSTMEGATGGTIEGGIPAGDIPGHVARRDEASDGQRQNLGLVTTGLGNPAHRTVGRREGTNASQLCYIPRR